jgi:23S rRNA pseudouridine1911/1915/1917 synthase
MEEIELVVNEQGIRIDAWIAKKNNNFSRSYVQKLIDDGLISVNGKDVKSNYKLKSNDRILIKVPEPQILDVKAEDIKIPIIYEDEYIIVVDKPKGMVVHPACGNYSGTLVNALMNYCGDRLSDINGIIRPGIVHRIDKDTSGVIVVAKTNKAHEALSEKLKVHDIKRVYVCIAEGVIHEEVGRIDAPIGRHHEERKKMAVNPDNGRRAVTHFKVLERFKDATYLEVTLETGRTHQIRVHMSYIGHPLLGDTVYGRKKQKYDLGGQALHARVLGFEHPITGKYMEFESPIPEYFESLLTSLRSSL